jgi:hypothetical protein
VGLLAAGVALVALARRGRRAALRP